MAKKISNRSFRSQLGASMLEYGLMIVLILSVSVVGVRVLGRQFSEPCPGDPRKIKADVGYGLVVWYMSPNGDQGPGGNCIDPDGGDHGD